MQLRKLYMDLGIWIERFAEHLGCDPKPATIAVKLQQFMDERDSMQRTIGQLRARLAYQQELRDALHQWRHAELTNDSIELHNARAARDAALGNDRSDVH